MNQFLYIGLGLAAGVFSGMFGVGGGDNFNPCFGIFDRAQSASGARHNFGGDGSSHRAFGCAEVLPGR